MQAAEDSPFGLMPPNDFGVVIPFDPSAGNGTHGEGAFDEQNDTAVMLEKAALGAALIDPSTVPVLLELDEPDFFRTAHRLIRRSMARLVSRSAPVDFTMVISDLSAHRELDDVGGPAYIAGLTEGVAFASNIRGYVDQLSTFAKARRARAALTRALTDLSRRPAEAMERLAEDVVSLSVGRTKRQETRILSDVELLNAPAVAWLVERRFPASSIAVGYGEPGIGKTFVFFDLAMSVATGMDWLGASVKQGTALYVAAEGGVGLKGRLEAWKVANQMPLDEDAGIRIYPAGVNLLDAVAVERFIAQARAAAPTLIVFDTLSRCMVGADENSARDMGLAIAGADRVRTALDASVLLVHHSTKAGTAERGSSALRGAADVMFALTETDDLLRLTCEKQKDAEPFAAIALRLSHPYPGAASLTVSQASETGSSTELTDTQEKALFTLQNVFGPRGALWSEWRASAPDIKERTFYRARTVLEERGLVTSTGQSGRERYFAAVTR